VPSATKATELTTTIAINDAMSAYSMDETADRSVQISFPNRVGIRIRILSVNLKTIKLL
jgi:hypothetical protein